ncbi:MAG: NUDIX domain-containing protein [Porticoccaceae bacterium]|nr:NUDIX domain-containing protein [Porticoccaceae bacterium]
MVKKHQFSQSDVRIESRETVFQGFFRVSRFTLSHRLFRGGWSRPIKREIFQRVAAVGVLLYDPANQLIGLVEQFRVGALDDNQGPWQYEVVAGMIEQGETPIDVAHREIQEEAGLTVKELIPICEYLVSAGATNEKMHMFCGLADLQDKKGVFGLDTENEDILLHIWSYEEAMQALADGVLNSAAVTISLQWLELRHKNL